MILVACIDDIGGMSFFGRRQSRDSTLIAELIYHAAGKAIYMSPRSAALFEGSGANVISSENFAEKAGEGEYCFLEFSSPAALEPGAEKIILYRWNRRYQSDLKFDIELGGWKLESCVHFPGSSHEKITKEIYVREQKEKSL